MLVHWIWLATRQGLNDREKCALLERFRDPEAIYYADAETLKTVPDLDGDALQALQDKNLADAEQVLADCAKKKIQILTVSDTLYPPKLKNIPDPPLVLYYKGNFPVLEGVPVIGVVGTRKASTYGLTHARRMGYQIGACGGYLVSGAARGIDSEAMTGALTAGSVVIGVLGCGVDVVYPLSNKGLYEDLERHGCLISEFVPGTPPYGWNFPKRNRIISGMADGVLVVEAPEKSGALITARQAADQGRDVFAVPGNIDVPSAAGTNALLRDGAILVSTGADVVGEYRHLYPDRIRLDIPGLKLVPKASAPQPKVAQKPALPRKENKTQPKTDKKDIDKRASSAYSDGGAPKITLNAQEEAIVSALAAGEMLVDELIASTALPSGKLLASLTMLEVRGIVKMLPGRRVKLLK